eukprot:jgi/Chlat1/2726/Chrsp182S08759
MLFGLSFGEVALLLGVGAVVFGQKDLPVIARAAGKVSGRALGYIYRVRQSFDSFAERNQLNELHQELQQGLQQLNAIRDEIRGGVSVVQTPGPLTRAALRHAGIDPANTAPEHNPQAAPATASQQELRPSVTIPPPRPVAATYSYTPQASVRQLSNIQVLPVSARGLGLVPDRKGRPASGSELLAEAFEERMVALKAQELLGDAQLKDDRDSNSR